MSAPARVALGASTTNRKYYLDVNTGTFGSPTWVPVCGITDFKNNHDPDMQEDSDFDSGGWKSSTKTAEAWGVELKVGRKVTVLDATAYDPGQEFLRAHAIGQMGPSNTVDIRFYEMEPGGPREEAYRGNAAVSWSPDGGGMPALSTVTVTLTGQGALSAITHPDA